MPSNRRVEYDYESCYPCKWFRRRLWQSGRNPIYRSDCTNPKVTEMWASPREARFIGNNTDKRPHWCPIRGDKQAELEAKQGDPLHQWFETDEDQP